MHLDAESPQAEGVTRSQVPTLQSLSEGLEALAQAQGLTLSWHDLPHRGGLFRFPRLASPDLAGRRILMVGAGIHGNEVAGPVSILRHGAHMFAAARDLGLAIVSYPLRNPSGYGCKRYNADLPDEAVAMGNNDFLRYELSDGAIVDDLTGNDRPIRTWGWSSEPRFEAALPPETRLMHDLLRLEPLHQVDAVVDLHQDLITPHAPPRAYHYAYGDVSIYADIVAAVDRVVPVWRARAISAGFVDGALETDALGFIERHDGTWPDLMRRIGEAHGRRIHAVTVETTGSTALDLACEVNRLWVCGLLEVMAGAL